MERGRRAFSTRCNGAFLERSSGWRVYARVGTSNTSSISTGLASALPSQWNCKSEDVLSRFVESVINPVARLNSSRQAPKPCSGHAQEALEQALVPGDGLTLEMALTTSGLMQQDVMRAVLQAKPADRYRHISTVLGLERLRISKRRLGNSLVMRSRMLIPRAQIALRPPRPWTRRRFAWLQRSSDSKRYHALRFCVPTSWRCSSKAEEAPSSATQCRSRTQVTCAHS